MKRARVKLTLQQADQVDWALEPMESFWCTQDGAHERGESKVCPVGHLPRLLPDGDRKTSRILELSQDDEINSDLLYRLEVKLSDMAHENEDPAAKGDARAGRNAALRIRHRRPGLANMPIGGGWI